VNKAHFPRDVLLTSVGDKFQLSFDGVDYLPTSNPTAAGALLFGLRPAGIKFSCDQSPDTFMWLASQAGYILHKFANGETHAVDDSELLPMADLLEWIASATALAPTLESALAAHNLIVENLGPRCAHMRNGYTQNEI
jgi:hypothetical protein